jgi:hypothetical protein
MRGGGVDGDARMRERRDCPGLAGMRGWCPAAGRGSLVAGRGSPVAGRVAGGGEVGQRWNGWLYLVFILFLDVFRIFKFF